MPETGKTLVEKLRKLSASFKDLTPDNKELIVRIGSQLEELAGCLPSELYKLSSVLNLALNALQAVYEKTSDDPFCLVNAIEMSLVAVGDFLSDAPNKNERLNDAGRALWITLGRSPEECPYRDDALNQKKIATLDEIAASLIRLEAQDLLGLSAIREMVRSLYESSRSPAGANQVLGQILKKLDASLEAGVCSQEILTSTGALIETAMSFVDQGKEGNKVLKEASLPDAQNAQSKKIKSKAADTSSKPAETTDSSPEPQKSQPAQSDASLIADYVTESFDYIEKAEAALLALETDASNAEAVNIVFRAFHTIKGTSSFLGYTLIAELAHKAENLLSKIRDKKIQYSGGYADLALRSVDMLKLLLEGVRNSLGGEPIIKPGNYDQLLSALGDPHSSGVSEKGAEDSGVSVRIGDILVSEGKVSRQDIEDAVAQQGNEPLGMALIKSKAASLSDVGRALRTQQQIKGGETFIDSSVRVRTDRLDRLIDMIGELVIAHSMVAQDKTMLSSENDALLKKVQHTAKFVRELQDLSMLMRMVPLKSTFQKMARLVRDLSQKNGKVVNFISEGEETEIDRNMVDIINDPLVHMMRNAIDHGIEYPDEREKAGKPSAGSVKLSAYHQSGNIIVEIQDDGRGLDRQKILDKAVEKGLLEAGKELVDNEIYNLIFLPGFSTADKITDVSGRGVGMDVVKKNIEALHGRIEIISRPGMGSTFIVKFPLTMAITDGMLLKVGSQRYVLPTVNISMSFRPAKEAVSTVANSAEMVMFRGRLIPIVRLHRIFGITDAAEDISQALLVVVEDREDRCALLVDDLITQQQVVVKSLGGTFVRKAKGVSGGAIMGDGRVGLILDVQGIIALSRGDTVKL